MTPPSSLRSWILLAITLVWIWASSIFTPWAEHRLPRLWLYDALFYLRHALAFWAAAETIHLVFHWREHRQRRALLPLACAMLAVVGAWAYQHSEIGMRWRLAASREAVLSVAAAGFSDTRRRAGHFLVDSVREPCRGQAWLWLGRPHGGGTGTNVALVHAGARAPLTPSAEAFAFWPAGHGWWLAYQHAARHQAMPAQRPGSPTCAPGRVLSRQRDGMAMVDDGRRALRDR